jgi:uncharacterized membrane protein YdfJ with MMPL/SSD domain
MQNHRLTFTRSGPRPGPLARGVSAVAGGAARRPKLTIALWLALITACVVVGAQVGTRMLSDAASGTGQSAKAQSRLSAAGLQAPAVENVLVRSPSPTMTMRAATELQRQARALPSVASVRGPARTPALSRAGGRTALVQVQLRGDPDNADEHVAPLQAVVARVARVQPDVRLQEAGDASGGHAINQVIDTDLHHAELISLPITLLILLVAFGALVAAVVPLLLGLTSVAGALGALGLVSHLVPAGGATASVVVLIGLAVGVDYSLFYIRREREERRAGRDADAALIAATASVGRAIVVAAMTVIVGLAGLLFTGLGVFTSMALGAIIVVAIAALGSVTVLPAVLALLGDRIDRGRLWRRRRRGHGRKARPGAWERIATAITARPRAALLVTAAVLGALALPVLGMRTADPGEHDLSAHNPVLVAEQAIERAFPGAPDDAQLVVAGHDLGRPAAQRALRALGQRAEAVTRGRGAVGIQVSRDGETALLSVPFADRGLAPEAATVAALRNRVDPTLAETLPGSTVQVTGDAAENVDFSGRLDTATPIVIALVLGLAFVLLVAAFGSPRLAAGVIGLNLLSVGAAFGILVEVFQHGVGQSVLGFTSDGAIVEWLPLFAFVVLFGLSMDYTVLILERVREARADGADARTAAVQALGATAGTVTSAAAVMVGVFAIFATLNLLEFKQLGFGLAIAILLDATIVRAVALPAVVTVLGGRAAAPRAARFRRPIEETALR